MPLSISFRSNLPFLLTEACMSDMKRKPQCDMMDVIQDIAKKELPLPGRMRRSGFRDSDDVVAWGRRAARALEVAFEAERARDEKAMTATSRRIGLLPSAAEACMGCMKPKHQRRTAAIIEDIAKKELGIQTLETRRMDSLDFHDLAVWQVKAALEAAYRAGQAAATAGAKR